MDGRSRLTMLSSPRSRDERSQDRRLVQQAHDDMRDPLSSVALAEGIPALADMVNPASVLVRLLEHERQARRLPPNEACDARLDRFRPLRVFPEYEHGLTQRRRLFLHTARIRDEQPGAREEDDEVLVPERRNEMNPRVAGKNCRGRSEDD